MTQNKPTPVTVTLTDDSYISADELPINLDNKEWGAVLEDYDRSTKYNWVQGDWLDKKEENGTIHFSLSGLEQGDWIRVGAEDEPAVFRIANLKSNKAVLLHTPSDVAISFFKGKKATQKNNKSATSNTKKTTKASSSSNATSSSSSKSRKDHALPKKSAVVGGDFDRSNAVEEFEGTPVFGYLLMYTTGKRILVPRDELLDKMEELGFEPWMAPTRVKPYRAFPRMCRSLLEDGRDKKSVNGYRVEFQINGNGSRYDKMFVAGKHIPEEECGEEGGNWEFTDVARMEYDSDNEALRTSVREEAKGTELAEVWSDTYEPLAHKLFEKHQEFHNGKDLNDIMAYFVDYWTDAVRIRDACYFVPALYSGLQDQLSAFNDLYEWLDVNYKKRGQKTETHYLGVTDTGQHKGMVESAIKQEVRERVGDLFDEIVKKREEQSKDVSEVAAYFQRELGDIMTLSDSYGTLSDKDIDVKALLSEEYDTLDARPQHVCKVVLNEAGIKPQS